MSMDYRFRGRLRTSTLASLLPDWTDEAACASRTLNGSTWDASFADEMAERPDTDYRWSDRALEAMGVCATCPVRDPCLAYAYDFERTTTDRWYTDEMTEESRRFGIYGGVPGRIREHYAKEPDRLERCRAWADALARERGWLIESPEEATA